MAVNAGFEHAPTSGVYSTFVFQHLPSVKVPGKLNDQLLYI